MKFEDELRGVLARKRAPTGFAERVMSRVEAPPARRRPGWFAPLAVAASLAVGAVSVGEFRRIRAERAGRELAIALSIAADKIRLAETKAKEVWER